MVTDQDVVATPLRVGLLNGDPVLHTVDVVERREDGVSVLVTVVVCEVSGDGDGERVCEFTADDEVVKEGLFERVRLAETVSEGVSEDWPEELGVPDTRPDTLVVALFVTLMVVVG